MPSAPSRATPDMSSSSCTPPKSGASTRTPAISKMTKNELLQEALRLGLLVHQSWKTEEIKAVIVEHRMEHMESDPAYLMKSISKMSLSEMKAKADSLGVQYNDKVTKGNLMRAIRQSANTPGNELMKIGKFRGYEFQEIPPGYGEWALKEV